MKNAINSQSIGFDGIAKRQQNQGSTRINSMNKATPILNQMQSLISRSVFEKLVKKYNADNNVRTFPTWSLLKVMLFAQCTGKKSLRDICIGFTSMPKRMYHLGLKGVSRNNLSHSLAQRNAGLFEDVFYALLQKVQNEAMRMPNKRFRFSNELFSIDSTTISVCLDVFEWAKFRTAKGGVKVHTMLDVRNQIPAFAAITPAKVHDAVPVPAMPIHSNAIYVMDRGYLSFDILENINENGSFFVTRLKSNSQYGIIRTMKSSIPTILRDEEIEFTGVNADRYSGPLRHVRFKNPEDGKVYDYITNNMMLSASTIASIYKSRWDIELFFKWIKQNLRIKSFYGTSRNAVLIQIWTAMISFLLVSYIRFLSKTAMSLIDVFRVLGSNILSDRFINDLLCPVKTAPPRLRRCFEIQLDFGF